MEISRKVTCPAIHLNGSGYENLRGQYNKAYDALAEAYGALQGMSPHARDFYVFPDGEERFAGAVKEHTERLTKIKIIQEELVCLIDNLIEHGKNK